MGSRYEVEATLSAKDLKNINWKNGPIRPYVEAWVDPDHKVTSRVDKEGDTSPEWNQTLTVPLYSPVEDATLYFDVVHHTSPDEEYMKHLIGSAKLDLRDVVEGGGIGAPHACSLEFKRTSGGPNEKLKLEITIRELQYQSYPPPPPHYAGKGGESREPARYGDIGNKILAIGAVVRAGSALYEAGDAIKKVFGAKAVKEVVDDAGYPPPRHAGKGGESRDGHPYRQPPMAYGGQPTPYGDPGYRQPAYAHGHGYKEDEKKKSWFGGIGTGLAIGAAGAVSGIAAYVGYTAFTGDAKKEAAEEVEDVAGG